MRIAIITLQLMGNYGGILQNYALQTVLKRMGHTVETITLPLERKQPWWRKPLAYGKRSIDKYVLMRRKTPVFYEQWYNRTLPALIHDMQNFVAERITVRQLLCFSEIKEGEYDAFVVGSDQIWRPPYSYRPITDAYLGFAKEWDNIKRIAYAASFGTDAWEYTPKQTAQCTSLVRLFNAVSVREEVAVKLCRERLHCEAVHVLDPTMLLTTEDYIALFCDKQSEPPRGQLLTYVLDETPEKDQIIQKIADYYQYKIYQANSRFEDKAAPLEERVQPPVEQWLKDFYDAKFVITDSFHATVFSILFGKSFIVIGNKERGLSRIDSLLRMFGLEKHVVHAGSEPDVSQDYAINVQQIQTRLQTWREKSVGFLWKGLQAEKSAVKYSTTNNILI